MQPFTGVDRVRLLTNAMKVAEFNHRVIANNIANADTPGFNATHVDFQGTLRTAIEGRDRAVLRRSQARHFDAVRYRPSFGRIAFSSKNDYNKVDLDEEIAKLSENTGRYTTYGSLLNKEFQMVKNVLSNMR